MSLVDDLDNLHQLDLCAFVSQWWYHHPMTTATAEAASNIAFIKYSGEKPGRNNGAAGFGAGNITSGSTLYRENQDKTNSVRR